MAGGRANGNQTTTAGALIAARIALMQALSQTQSGQRMTDLMERGLTEQQRQAMLREQLATADRTDAYGNKTTYTPGQGFQTENTALTQSILDAQQKEQQAQFREDAPRMRQAAERTDTRAREAGNFYDELFNDYRYGRKKSEQEYIAEAVRDAASTRKDAERQPQNDAALSRLALRLGSGAAETLKKASGNPVESLAAVLSNARQTGTQRYLQEDGARKQNQLGEMEAVRRIADGVMGGTPNWTNPAGSADALTAKANSDALQTSVTNSQTVGNAQQILAQALGQGPDLSGLIAAFANLDKPGEGNQNQALYDAFFGNSGSSAGAWS